MHARYVELAARFKACWTFHRFQEGLQKFFGMHDLGPIQLEFQSLYKRLKGASAALEAADSTLAADALRAELEDLATAIGEALEELGERDEQVPPSLLRRFFERVDSYDDRILIDMIRFYQEVQRGRTWSNDRIDKVDFLVSALAKRLSGPDLSRGRDRLGRVLDALARGYEGAGSEEGKVRNRLELLDRIRAEVNAVGSLSELEETKLLEQYRTLKHSLGEAYFERSLLGRIVATNTAVGKLVVRVTSWEQERIFSDYERLSEIESSGDADSKLRDAVTQIGADVGTIRKKIETGGFRVAEVIRLRDSLGSIDRSLKRRAEGAEEPAGSAREPASLPVSRTAAAPGSGVDRTIVAQELLGDRASEPIAPWLDVILAALGETDRDAPEGELVVEPPLRSYRLEPREVVAYRRLSVAGGDVPRESFLLAAAALRCAMERAEDDPEGVGSAAPARTSRVKLLDVADRYLRELSHHLEKAGRESPVEAEALLRCRMRFMRAYSGMWLGEASERRAQRSGGSGS